MNRKRAALFGYAVPLSTPNGVQDHQDVFCIEKFNNRVGPPCRASVADMTYALTPHGSVPQVRPQGS